MSIFYSTTALGGDLKDVVNDLFGGDGIFLAPPAAGINHAPHFTAQSLEGLDTLTSAIASNVGFLPINSIVTGFSFDIETGEPIRVAESLGPLLAERANPLGKGIVQFGFTYTRVKYTDFEGQDLDDFSLILVHEDANGNGILDPPGSPFEFERDQVRVDVDLQIKQDIFAFFANYGLTPNLDVGVVVPIIHASARAVGNASIVDNSPTLNVHFFDPSQGSDPTVSKIRRSKTGVGDIILRGKYAALLDSEMWPDLAIGTQITLPTGDRDNFLGSETASIQAIFIVSKNLGILNPHFNVGYEWVPEDSQLNNLRYIVGVDATIIPELTGAVDILGRWEHDGNNIGDHTVDLAVGARYNFLDGMVFNGNAQIPLNIDEGLRAEIIWTVGFEYYF